jgi:hypothetical protein
MATVKKAKKYQGGGDVPSWASKINKQTEDERKNPALGDERRRKADSTAMASWKKAADFERAYHKKEGNKIEDRKDGSTAYTVLAKKKQMKSGGPVKKYADGGKAKSFPDLNKDGKITKADILKGRGVIAKKGAMIKKAGKAIVAKKIVKSIKKK